MEAGYGGRKVKDNPVSVSYARAKCSLGTTLGAKMAFAATVPRGLAARSLCAALTNAIRPKGGATVHTWRALSVASQPSWRPQDKAPNSRQAPWNHFSAISPSQRWSSTVSLTVPELEEQVLAVLKMFDKVKPEDVRKIFVDKL